MEIRTNKIFLLVGNRGTGKTDFCKKLINHSALPKKLVVDTFDSPVWQNMKTYDNLAGVNVPIPILSPEELPSHKQGLYRTFSPNTRLLEEKVAQYCTNSLVILEDSTRYYKPMLTENQRIYLLNSKQKNVDFVLVFHYLSAVPPEIVKLADYLTLFKTNEGFYDNKKWYQPEIKTIFDHIKKSKNRFENITIQLQ
ncbi:MAG: hypothetical protein HYU67_04585 [Flavobacteriia bacterium]|nr:hypothetical protein [Flavobacteriia bacterium]